MQERMVQDEQQTSMSGQRTREILNLLMGLSQDMEAVHKSLTRRINTLHERVVEQCPHEMHSNVCIWCGITQFELE